MKLFTHKVSQIAIAILILSLTGSFSSKNKARHKKKLTATLEIVGQPIFDVREVDGTYKVTLIYLNRIIDTLVLPVKSDFEFQLDKNIIYAVKIEKKGFLTKLISINTKMPQLLAEKSLYKFQFEIEMYKENLEKYLDSDDLDFPIAVISYDEITDKYEYSRKYTQCVIETFELAQKTDKGIVKR